MLRRAAREQIVPAYADETERISLETSHPRWLIEKWTGEFGLADAEKLATANNEIPRIGFRFTKRSARSDEFENTWASEDVEGCFLAGSNSPQLLAAADAGEIYFQDEGSQMVGASVNLTENGRFLDLCAAPGSKFTQILAGSTRSQMLVAGELHPRRVQFLAENCRNQGLGNANIVQYDAEFAIPFAEEAFDVILIDAPCSGTGTIRHNPEIRYTLEAVRSYWPCRETTPAYSKRIKACTARRKADLFDLFARERRERRRLSSVSGWCRRFSKVAARMFLSSLSMTRIMPGHSRIVTGWMAFLLPVLKSSSRNRFVGFRKNVKIFV